MNAKRRPKDLQMFFSVAKYPPSTAAITHLSSGS